jgi:hypothetical protein
MNKQEYKGVFSSDFEAHDAIEQVRKLYSTANCPECDARRHPVSISD